MYKSVLEIQYIIHCNCTIVLFWGINYIMMMMIILLMCNMYYLNLMYVIKL